MIRGLQITLTGEELSRRIGERIRVHEIAISALDARLEQRRGDQEFDVRAEDGFKTVGELEKERQQYLTSRSHDLDGAGRRVLPASPVRRSSRFCGAREAYAVQVSPLWRPLQHHEGQGSRVGVRVRALRLPLGHSTDIFARTT